MSAFDITIISTFFVAIIAAGFYFGTGIKNINDYAIGDRKYSNHTIGATLAATWIGGGFFSLTISKTYSDGIGYMILGLGEVIAFLILAKLIAPRMSHFLGKLSVAEAMGDTYGKSARIITSLAGLARVIGTIAIQFKVCSTLMSYFFGVSTTLATILSASTVILYSSFGGIKAVTVTDVIQLVTFSIFIPILSLAIWGTIDNPEVVINTISNHAIFDLNTLFALKGSEAYSFIALILLFIIPGMDPAIFQRIAIAKDITQARKSLEIATTAFFFILLITFWISILLLSHNGSLNPDNLVSYIIDYFAYPGLKGLLLSGVMAMLMSTADSYINSASILFVHDFCIPLKIKAAVRQELLSTRICAVFIGLFALLLALSTTNLFQIILGMASFYMPLVTVPLMLSIFGFRINSKSYLLSMFIGAIVITASYIVNTGIDGIILSVCSILLVLLSMIFVNRFTSTEPSSLVIRAVNKNNQEYKENSYLSRLKSSITSFDLLKFLDNNTPKKDSTFAFLGLFCIASVFSTMYSTSTELRNQNLELITVIYHSSLTISTLFLTYPIWPSTFKNTKIMAIIWSFGLFFILVFVSCIQVIISNFGQFQLMTFLLSMIVLSMLVRWQMALLMMLIGIVLGVQSYKYYSGIDTLAVHMTSIQFKIMYILLMISSILIAFLKPKQEYVEATEAKVEDLSEENTLLINENTTLVHKIDDYSDKLTLQEKEMARLGETAQRILNNVNHELRLPVGNVMNFAEMLSEGLGKYSEEQLKELSDEVLQNTNRLSSMILNMLDLATLDAKKIELDKSTTNLSRLVEERAKHCFKLYKDNKQLQFKLDIEPEILVKVDPNYIRQTADNLVINAIRYSQKGTITVTLRKNKDQVIFTISDEGLGIPQNELLTIFEPFQQSSKTTSKAEGRGVGLALCKAAVEAHGGAISAESEAQGARFRFVLPL